MQSHQQDIRNPNLATYWKYSLGINSGELLFKSRINVIHHLDNQLYKYESYTSIDAEKGSTKFNTHCDKPLN